jgi:hypothetical protein
MSRRIPVSLVKRVPTCDRFIPASIPAPAGSVMLGMLGRGAGCASPVSAARRSVGDRSGGGIEVLVGDQTICRNERGVG